MKNSNGFLDIRNHGFVRVGVVIPPVALADPGKNVDHHLTFLDDARKQGAQYALCPELGLTGYSCGDLFHSQVLQQAALAALQRLLGATRTWPMLISVGMPLVVDGALYNVAVTFSRGKIHGVAPKSYPPEYREFYELRHFAQASEARSTTVALFGALVLFGTDILIRMSENDQFVLHTEICEDIWVPIPPSTVAAVNGATVLANLSASNITIAKSAYREQLVVQSSGRNLAVQMYSAAGFGESTTDLSWDGDALVAERGQLIARNERFSLTGSTLVTDVDLDSLILDRMRQSSFHQNARDFQRPMRTVIAALQPELRAEPLDPSVYATFLRQIASHPFVPADLHVRDERCRETFLIQATSLARRLMQLPQDRRRVIIGVSGGQDSTHALMVAVHATDLLKLPRTNIVCLTMPGLGTSERTHTNSLRLIKAVGAEHREIPISQAVLEVFRAIGHDPEVTDLTFENTQAWMRKLHELATCAEVGGMDLGTGDLSELMLGWCTMFGDHASHYGINAGVPKTLISYLIRWTAEVLYKDDEAIRTTLLDILDTPISPELTPIKDGVIAQKTEDIIGPYELHDFFGYYHVRFGMRPSRIARMAFHAFAGKYTLGEIKKWLGVFLQRFFANQFKRSCLPDGPKVGLTCISPRGDWRMPSDASVNAWLAELQSVPETLS